MGVKGTAKQVATGVALAAAGCGTDTVSVDPVPPPLVCSQVGQGQSLAATATREGTRLMVRVSQSRTSSLWPWSAREVIDPRGVTVVSVEGGSAPPYDLTLTLQLEAETTTTGSFTLRGRLASSDNACDVTRTFTFRIGAQVEITALDPSSLPLATRHPARIAVLSREGFEVLLEARSSFGGPFRCTWRVSDGELIGAVDARARWRLPERQGVYQAQVVVDYGPQGLAFDALSLEVA